MPQGHQPRQPVRRGSQHPNFTELIINSASFLSPTVPAVGAPLSASVCISHLCDGFIIAHKPNFVKSAAVSGRFLALSGQSSGVTSSHHSARKPNCRRRQFEGIDSLYPIPKKRAGMTKAIPTRFGAGKGNRTPKFSLGS